MVHDPQRPAPRREIASNGLGLLLQKSLWSGLNRRRLLREQSRFRLLFTALFCLGLLALLWGLFFEGFQFLHGLGGVGLMVIHQLFALFFFGMGIMLVLSGMITSYASMYRSEEVPFLFLRPFHRGDIVLFKFFESALLSSWNSSSRETRPAINSSSSLAMASSQRTLN